jgi:hypothetical protein
LDQNLDEEENEQQEDYKMCTTLLHVDLNSALQARYLKQFYSIIKSSNLMAVTISNNKISD